MKSWKKNRTPKYKERLLSLLPGFKKQGKITLKQYRDLDPTSDIDPMSSPKIHKEGILLHPSVDYTGSMTYKKSKAFVDLLKPLVGKIIYQHLRSYQE